MTTVTVKKLIELKVEDEDYNLFLAILHLAALQLEKESETTRGDLHFRLASIPNATFNKAEFRRKLSSLTEAIAGG